MVNLLFSSVWQKVWQMNRSAKGLLIVTTNLDDFSLANCRLFAKFVKLSSRQTFLLYGKTFPVSNSVKNSAKDDEGAKQKAE